MQDHEQADSRVQRAMAELHEELAWLSFMLPREAVQLAGRHLPLARLRDHLPRFIGERLRMGLYPARVTDPLHVSCARNHPAWGEPPALDPARPVRYPQPPRASILIVTYGNLELTRLCLCSLQRAAGPLPFEILVVDNSSPDGTAAYLREVEGSGLLPLRAILNRDNRGFAAANNQAAEQARGDVLVLLNNDTVVRPGWLEALVATLDADPSVGLVGPVTNSSGTDAQLGTPYHDLDEMQTFAAAYTAAHAGKTTEPVMLALFCTALPRALYTEIGGLDERYGLGLFEDDDLAMAVRRAGRNLVLRRDVFVHHYGGAAFGKLPPRRYLRLWWQNRRRFERKWRTTWQKR
jgi:GT2 family glycosyltransferase